MSIPEGRPSKRDWEDELVLQAATPDNAEAIQHCSNRAFADSYLTKKLFPTERAHFTSTEELLAFRVQRLREAVTNDHALFYKITREADSGHVVAFVGSHRSDFLKSPDAQTQPTSGQLPDPPEAVMDVQVHKELLERTKEQRSKVLREDTEYWCKLRFPLHKIQAID